MSSIAPSLEEFNSTFINFREIYEECSSLIAIGIELETTDENKVSWSTMNESSMKVNYMTQS